ncbi:6667_t:CDS:1, partial [Racocetra persica]
LMIAYIQDLGFGIRRTRLSIAKLLNNGHVGYEVELKACILVSLLCENSSES